MAGSAIESLRAKWRIWASCWVVAAVAATLLVAVSPDSAGSDGTRRWITDDQGRALVLNGLNTASSAKSEPNGMPWIKAADVQREKQQLGSNFVRFLIQWRNVEPRPGAYDDTYLDQVAERVHWYGARGYHVMLDMHQDVYGPKTKGNGAPAWATQTDGLPVAEQDQWELKYIEPGTMRAFDHFWGSKQSSRNLRARYAAAWAHVARRFRDDPAVIGYDLMNEPWGGSVQGPAFEAGPLAALYRRTLAAIREVDHDSWIFVEPEAVSTNWGLPSGLPYLKDPRGDGDRARIAYAPHVYPLPLDLGSGYSGDAKAWVRRTLGSWRTQTERTARRLNAPVVIGEYGVDATLPGALTYVAAVRRLAEKMGAGTAYWSNDPGPWSPWERTKHGGLRATRLLPVLDRPTPLAIAGEPGTYEWDATSRTLKVSWRGARRGVRGGTELYLPERHFPRGGLVTGGDVISWDAKSRILVVRSGPGEHRVRITPVPDTD
ncbi:cellulase family glycosylhydrolase [Streptomyces sp. NPDC056105]|uniref:cellulase family glycosylhydrolase n=1 Tax=Streptomyces sp. NPDC056105 TaxID=3345714 RepID=UPI0035DEBFA7